MSDNVFQPEVWATSALKVLRSNLVVSTWNHTAAKDEVAQAERVAAYRMREAQRQADIAAMEERLATFPAVLQPIIALHARDGRQCTGCDVDGYECEQPEWPCRTIQTILGDTDE